MKVTLPSRSRRDPAYSVAHSGHPGRTPKERVRILRETFADTMSAAEFLADAKKSKLDINPLSGEEAKTSRSFQDRAGHRSEAERDSATEIKSLSS